MQDTNSFYLNGNGDRSVAWGGGVSWDRDLMVSLLNFMIILQ